MGFIFSREDWLWQRLAYQNEIIKAIEAQNCNVIAVFSTTMPNEQTGAVSLDTAFERFFYQDGKPCIDVLINPFVFSLTDGVNYSIIQSNKIDFLCALLRILILYVRYVDVRQQ